VGVVRVLCALKRPPDTLAWIWIQRLVLLLAHTAIRDVVRERDRLSNELREIATEWTIPVLAYPADASAIGQFPFCW
jgi:hypothetical protein